MEDELSIKLLAVSVTSTTARLLVPCADELETENMLSTGVDSEVGERVWKMDELV